MRSIPQVLVLAMSVCFAALPCPGIRVLTFAGEMELNGHRFQLPEGFTIELVAGPPLVDRPITADFDEQGRLYVSDSSGSNDRVDKQLQERPHRILRLIDTDGDGRFDERTVFADKMMFPEGTLWHDGSLYVAAPPSIWKLTDTNDDGVADERLEWFQGKTLTGCANDLHGPYLGPDGWIYWCKGAFAEQTYERPGRKPLITKASHIFRCRPNGSGIEPVMTGGMDNPVDVIFTPGGERIFTTTFLQNPAGGKRDGLLHAVYGGVYGKVHGVLDNHPRTDADVMPVLSHLGAAAPCGLACYESSQFGAEYRGNVFAALFNMQKITRHQLTPEGGTYRSTDSDFVVSANRDFHPTDVLEDADGSLLIVDTGGWYKLCCPTSQLSKPDVLGGLYRVKNSEASRVADPRGLELDWTKPSISALITRLGDARPAVQKRAMESLARIGPDVLVPLAKMAWGDASGQAKRNALWTATRIDDPAARDLVRGMLADRDPLVRQSATHSISLWRDEKALVTLVSNLERVDLTADLSIARVSAEALGRIGSPTVIDLLLEAAGRSADRFFEHSVIYALMEIGHPIAVRAGLSSTNPRTRRAALIALDQMDDGGIDVATVLACLNDPDPTLKATATWISSHHPEWGKELAGFLKERLNARNLADSELSDLPRQLGAFAATREIQQLLAERAADESAAPHSRLIALQAMSNSGLKELPDSWTEAVIRLTTSPSSVLLHHAIQVTRAIPVPKAKVAALNGAMSSVVANDQLSNGLRLDGAAAMVGGLPSVSADLFGFLLSNLSPNNPVASRIAAADVLSKAQLTPEQLGALAGAMRSVGPLEADRLLAAFERSTDEKIGRQLIVALRESPSLASIRLDALRPRLAKYGKGLEPDAEALYAIMNVDAAKQRAQLEELLPELKDGDIRRGQAIFNSAKAACSACHAIGYLGGKLGPDLTRIAQTRQERDLLEAIVFPNASFVRSFEPVAVVTVDGRVLNGLVQKESADEITLTISATETVRVRRDDIEEIRPSTVSIMPSGLDKQLTKEQLADLLAFLKACK